MEDPSSTQNQFNFILPQNDQEVQADSNHRSFGRLSVISSGIKESKLERSINIEQIIETGILGPSQMKNLGTMIPQNRYNKGEKRRKAIYETAKKDLNL